MDENKDNGRELDWNEEIGNDEAGGGGFILLPPGEYPFRVVKYERKRFAGSPKLPSCNQIVLHLDVGDDNTGIAHVQNSLFLHSKTEGLLCAFFRAIGARKHGERMVMDWNTVAGATGRCKLGSRTWDAKDGSKKESNEVKAFIDAATAAAANDDFNF